jgi:hypothetical protein
VVGWVLAAILWWSLWLTEYGVALHKHVLIGMHLTQWREPAALVVELGIR